MNSDQRYLHDTLKMNSEFWLSRQQQQQQQPGPQQNSVVTGNGNNFSPLMESSANDYHLQRTNSADQSSGNGFHTNATNNNSSSTNNNNNNNNNNSNNNNNNNNNTSNVDNLNDNNNRVVDTKDQMLTGVENQENFSHSPNGFHQQQQQHQDTTDSSPVAENLSSDLKFNADKFVNEIQQLSRSNNPPSINERTLEECWSTLQRIFMHKSAIQMQHARDIQRGSVSGVSVGGEVKPHQCQQCLKSFSSNHQLVQHIRVHTGEKPYKCTYCDRRFKQLSHVQQHTRLHTGERPYKCHLQECGRAFIQLSNLQQHLRNHDAQVERAKNRPFHCNICGKGFATESSLRTHTSKELQLHLGVLQQHAALIGGPNATSCLICHKLFLGADALMEHMKHHHKQEPAANIPSTPSSVVDPLSPNDQYNLAKQRRVANHPCPVCGKSYVNEGSLRKHLTCHPETSQLANSLRMWPCSVCQAVFTHEAGLLTHMEHMRMDPKHQFAAQYMLSRAAAERREQIAANLLSIAQNSRGASPALSDTSSCNERLSPPPENLHNNTSGNNNNNNSNNNNNNNNNTNVNNDGNPGINESASDNNNNTNGATNPLSLNNAAAYNHKHPMNDVLRSQGTGGQLHHQYQQVVANALSAAAQNQNSCNGLVSPVNPSTSAAQAISSLVAMRQTQSHGMNGSQQPSPTGPYHHNSQSITNHQNNPHHHHQDQSDAAMRIQEALRSQAEAALRLAVSQAAAVVASNGNTTNEISSNNQYRHNNAYGHQSNSINNLQSQFVGPDLSEALRLQEQRIEQALRLHNNELGLHQQQHQHP